MRSIWSSVDLFVFQEILFEQLISSALLCKVRLPHGCKKGCSASFAKKQQQTIHTENYLTAQNFHLLVYLTSRKS